MIDTSEAARALRAIPSEARRQASAQNGHKGGRPKGTKVSEEARERMKAAQAARRERERQEQQAGAVTPVRGKRGRPRKGKEGEEIQHLTRFEHNGVTFLPTIGMPFLTYTGKTALPGLCWLSWGRLADEVRPLEHPWKRNIGGKPE